MHITKLFCLQPGKPRRLMNTITFSSRFHSIPRTTREGFRMDRADNQLSVAREIAQAWHRANHYPEAKYEIEQDSQLHGIWS